MNKNTYHYLTIIFLILITITILQPVATAENHVIIEIFYKEGCGTCEEKEPIIEKITETYENIEVKHLSISIPENRDRMYSYGLSGIPSTAIINNNSGNYSTLFRDDITEENLKTLIDYYLLENNTSKPPKIKKHEFIDTPFGKINLSGISLPVLTIIIGLIDSVNPCAFFILLFLLNLLLYAKSRKRMFIIGGIFIFFSGFIYFLIMIALYSALNLVEIRIITIIGGIVALTLGSVNIKDFFFFKKGISLSIPKEKKQKLFTRMRNLVRIEYLPSMIIATIVLAITVNTFELACTLGLPLVFTDILLINDVSMFQSYLYILVYNIVYVIPLVFIVLVFVLTLGKRKLSEFQGRFLKLFSGIMMFSFGIVLLFLPSLFTDVFPTVFLIIFDLIIAVFIGFLWKNLVENKKSDNI
jgi:thiol-disulfide isomerase/thioredoxin